LIIQSLTKLENIKDLSNVIPAQAGIHNKKNYEMMTVNNEHGISAITPKFGENYDE